MNSDFQLLNSLKNHAGYKRLQELWLEEISDIEAHRDSAASRGQESAWRYQAGQEKGAKRIAMRLEVELAKLEDEGGEVAEKPSEVIEKMLAEARGEQK